MTKTAYVAIEQYYKMSMQEQSVIRSALLDEREGQALGVLRLYFPNITYGEIKALRALVSGKA